MKDQKKDENWKNLGLFKLKEESISDSLHFTSWHTGLYVDKTNLFY